MERFYSRKHQAPNGTRFNRANTRRLLLVSIATLGIELPATTYAQSSENIAPLRAVPEYSQAKNTGGYTWQKLFEDVTTNNIERIKGMQIFAELRLQDLGYNTPTDAPRDLVTAVIADYNNWQSLAFQAHIDRSQQRMDTMTDDFLTRLK